MAHIKVYIADTVGLDDGIKTSIKHILGGYFSRVVQGTDSVFSGVIITDTCGGISPRKKDLLCYIVANIDASVVQLFDTNMEYKDAYSGNTEFTDSAPYRACSEVYADKAMSAPGDKGHLFANLIFHELMHNKSCMGDEIHNDSVGGGGLAQEIIDATTPLTIANCIFMRSTLDTEIEQYLASF